MTMNGSQAETINEKYVSLRKRNQNWRKKLSQLLIKNTIDQRPFSNVDTTAVKAFVPRFV